MFQRIFLCYVSFVTSLFSSVPELRSSCQFWQDFVHHAIHSYFLCYISVVCTATILHGILSINSLWCVWVCLYFLNVRNRLYFVIDILRVQYRIYLSLYFSFVSFNYHSYNRTIFIFLSFFIPL